MRRRPFASVNVVAPRRVRVEMHFGVVAQHEIQSRLAITVDLHQVAELGVRNDDPWALRGLQVEIGQKVGDQGTVVALAIGMGRCVADQPGYRVVAHQKFGAEELTRQLASKLEPFRHVLGLLAIDDDDVVTVQRLRQRVERRGEDLANPFACFGQEGDTQVDRKPTQLAVESLLDRGQLVVLLGIEQCLAAAAFVDQKRVGEDVDQGRKREDILVAAATMSFVHFVEEFAQQHVPQKMQNGIGQRKSSDRLADIAGRRGTDSNPSRVVHDRELPRPTPRANCDWSHSNRDAAFRSAFS